MHACRERESTTPKCKLIVTLSNNFAVSMCVLSHHDFSQKFHLNDWAELSTMTSEQNDYRLRKNIQWNLQVNKIRKWPVREHSRTILFFVYIFHITSNITKSKDVLSLLKVSLKNLDWLLSMCHIITNRWNHCTVKNKNKVFIYIYIYIYIYICYCALR